MKTNNNDNQYFVAYVGKQEQFRHVNVTASTWRGAVNEAERQLCYEDQFALQGMILWTVRQWWPKDRIIFRNGKKV